jgi:hypothetical protein
MSASQVKTAVVPSPFHRRHPRRILLAALLAVLGAAAVYLGIGSPFASAAPGPAPPSHATTPTTEQSLPAYPANADADVGPGQVEPVLVGAP